MNTEHIYTLINKYWNCETSVAEEAELKAFFSGNSVPDDLKHYIPLFGYVAQEKAVSLSAGFDAKLNAAIEAKAAENKNPVLRAFAPLLRIAASVLLILGLGIGLFFISKENNDNAYFAETSSQSVNDALLEAGHALEKLSHALQLSESASIKTIQHIEELDIDWASLDAPQQPANPETETENEKISL